MPLSAGTRIGPYETIELVGTGGMGEVYRARDTRLKRDVALKILPDAVAHDEKRLARFQREAELLATLSHPHIAAIYGLEETDNGTRALVLELIEGPTLADRIAQGPMPLSAALPAARQIAEALEAAHDRGVIHRDLKPANIKLTTRGAPPPRSDGGLERRLSAADAADCVVKVLDFGLAKWLDDTERPGAASPSSPTVTAPMTMAGAILGTVAYMSPEQANGRALDRRTDVFAFGCVVYEMLTGRRAFRGETVPETLAAVLKTDPDWNALPADVPPAIRRLLRRCLQKDRHRRLQTVGDARIEIEEALTGSDPDTAAPPAVPRRGLPGALPWIAAIVLAMALAAALASTYLRTPVPAPEMRVDITTPATGDPVSLAVSSDGRQIAFVSAGDGRTRLWLRPLDATTAQPLAGTDGAEYPFWSPDGRSIGFFADAKLKRIDIGGGLPEVLADASAPIGGSWGRDGVILFAPALGSPLFRVPASGGDATPVTSLDPPRQISHRLPQFLPDGRQYTFFVQGTPDAQGIYLGSLDAPASTRLTPADTAGSYVPPGWLLFVRRGTLVARRFDVRNRALDGEPLTVADQISFKGGPFFVGAFSASATGLIAYRVAGTTRRQLRWFDRTGSTLGAVGASDENELVNPELSPDGRRVAVQRTTQNNTDLWLLDAARTTRFTFDGNRDVSPVWSPDLGRVIFSSNRNGSFDLYEKASTSAGSERAVLGSPLPKIAADWSPDGRYVLYSERDPKTGPDLWVLPIDASAKPRVFLQTAFSELWGQFSPDGRWVAYQSDESGRYEIYVRSFAEDGGQWQISTSGGVYPRWAPGGRELYYIAPEEQLMAVPLAVKGSQLEPGTPTALFQAAIVGGGANVVGSRQQYDVAPDGRFLINVLTDETTTTPITLLLNWTPAPKP